MSAEESTVSYTQLRDLEDDFEDVELELLRIQHKLSKDLYVKREKVISQIPNFWALVLEQAPPEFDEYVQPTDAAVIANSLVNLTVERFELPDGDPRSLSFKWEFSENEYFEDKIIEKKFWWRYAQDGWAGLVSEPVDIKWKVDKDLTSGMLSLANKVYQEDKAAGGKSDAESEAKKSLKAKMDETGLGGISFFTWFGFRGRNVSEDESKAAFKVEQEKRKQRKQGVDVDDDEEDDEEDDDDEYETEIFPTADDVAVTLAEDIYPGAIRYFIDAQEQEALSEMDFEDSDAEMEEADGDDEDKPASKKRKA